MEMTGAESARNASPDIFFQQISVEGEAGEGGRTRKASGNQGFSNISPDENSFQNGFAKTAPSHGSIVFNLRKKPTLHLRILLLR